MGGSAGLEIRAATPDDDEAVLRLLQASMGWVPDELSARFFTWKHRESPFGPSPAWVAVDEAAGEIVGFRTFMRWHFLRQGEPVEAVRAVDTATHPDFQGRGIFSALTRHALKELEADGVGFVFNTPNDRSRPGYLKMGWQLVGRLPVAARPRSPRSLLRMLRSRIPADKWSSPSDAGEPVTAVSMAPTADSPGLATARTPEYLRWRYGFPELHYRVMPAPGGSHEGFAVFRLRRRGSATEAAVCEVSAPDRRVAPRLVRDVVRAGGADHAVLLASARRGLGLRCLPVPRQGPTLVWRALNETTLPPPTSWHLTLGDVELF